MDFEREPLEVAEDLIGRQLTLEDGRVLGRIYEVEAYKDGKQTERRECMMRAPGEIGLMPFRGNDFINIGTEAQGVPSCVMIRAAVIDGELVDGPGKVGNALNAKSLEGRVARIRGQPAVAEFYSAEGRADNSLGGYRLFEQQ